MKKFLIILFSLLVMFVIIKEFKQITDKNVEDSKESIETINKSKEVLANSNAIVYIKDVNNSLITSLFNGDVIDGKYNIDNDKIILSTDENIYYEIPHKGTYPTEGSTLVISDGEVESGVIYMNGYKINYKKD